MDSKVMKKFNVGLIGFGMAGRVFHAPFIDFVDGLELTTIRETREENRKLIRERYPEVNIVNQTEQILDDPSIDLVVVCAPNHLHFELAKKALLSGKHVIVEKPFTVTSAEARELIKIASETEKLISVFQNRRCDSDFLTVRRIIQGGNLGRIVEYESRYDRFVSQLRDSPWKESAQPGTGLLYDLGSHLIDQALTLFGMPNTVTADLRIQRDQGKIIDYCWIMMDYGKFKVTHRTSMLAKGKLPKYVVFGTKGSFIKYGHDVQEEELKVHRKKINDPHWGKEPEEFYGVLSTEGRNDQKVQSLPGNYTHYYQNIYQALLGNQELEVKAEHALNTTLIIEAAMKSSEERRSVDV